MLLLHLAEGLFSQGCWWLNSSKTFGCQTIKMQSASVTLAGDIDAVMHRLSD